MTHPRTHVAVLGGGVLGISTAAELVTRGARVTVVTEGSLAAGASGRSLAWLNSFGIRSPEYHDLRLLGLDRYRNLAARMPGSERHLRFDGALTWVAPDRLEERRGAYKHMRDIGYDCDWVVAEDVPALAPGVDPSAVPSEGAVFNPQEGWVDLPWLVHQFAKVVVRRGGTIREHVGRVEMMVAGDRVTAVRTADGNEIAVDAAVLATGADTPREVARLGVTIPDATSSALLVRTPPIATALRTVLNTPRVAMRPAPDGGVVMDSGWSEREVGVGEDGSFVVRDETVQGLLVEASAVLAGHPRLTSASVGVGQKPIPGDGEPVLGPLEGVAGCYVAFTHSGATLGLIAGELLADSILRQRVHPLLQPFGIDRFG